MGRSPLLALADKAACANADPALMTSTGYSDHILAVSQFCTWCPVQALCVQVVKPRQSRFDGTSGGLYWLDGINMTVRLQSVTYLPLTVYNHYRVGSWRVREALAGRRDPRDLSLSEKMLFAYAAEEAGISVPETAEILGMQRHAVRMMAPVVRRDAPARVIGYARTWHVVIGRES
jgi:hypothetical protein